MIKNFVNDPNMPEVKEKAKDKLNGSHGSRPSKQKLPGFYSSFSSRAFKEFKNTIRLKIQRRAKYMNHSHFHVAYDSAIELQAGALLCIAIRDDVTATDENKD